MKNDREQDIPSQDARAPRRFGRSELLALGRFLTEQRKGAGLTLKRLAERSGISVASIRAMEAGRSSPSLTTVLGVVDALGVPIDHAIAAAHVEERRVVVTRSDPARHGMRHLSQGLADATLDAWCVPLDADSLQSVPMAIGQAPTLCMVTKGTVIAAQPDANRVKLQTGDSYHAQPGQVQTWANAGDGAAQLICVTHAAPRKSIDN